MKKYTFLDLARDVMKNEKRPLTVSQIWSCGEKLKLVEKIGSKGKTPTETLGARLYLDIRDNAKSIFVQVSKRPATFYLKNEITEKPELEDNNKEIIKFNERDLHVLLSSFVYANPNFRCVTKTIYHEKTGKMKKGFNQWLHPDIVGVHFPFEEYSSDILKLQETMGNGQYKFYSFEMKISLDFSNLREYYFQAVSNSSWANEGYLVTLKMDEDESFLSELKRLNNAFGIGIIKLNAENISQSEVLFSSKYNETLDWDTVERLFENPDFKEFVEEIKYDVANEKIRGKYDKVFTEEEASDYAKKKGII